MIRGEGPLLLILNNLLSEVFLTLVMLHLSCLFRTWVHRYRVEWRYRVPSFRGHVIQDREADDPFRRVSCSWS